MYIEYLKKGRRIVGNYEWSAGGGQIVEITDIETVANLLTLPTPQFRIQPGSKVTAAEKRQLAKLLGVDLTELGTALGIEPEMATQPMTVDIMQEIENNG